MCEDCDELFSRVGRKFGIDGHTMKDIIDTYIEEKEKVIKEQTGLNTEQVDQLLSGQPPQPLVFEGNDANSFFKFLTENGLMADQPKKKKENFEYN